MGSLRSTSLWIPVSVERALSSLTVVPCAVQKAWMKSQWYQHQHPLLELNFRHLFCPLQPHLYSMRCAVCCGVSRHSNAGWDCDRIALFVLNAFRWCRYTLLPERLCMQSHTHLPTRSLSPLWDTTGDNKISITLGVISVGKNEDEA